MVKYCTSCGTEMNDKDEFCSNCGVPYKEEDETLEEEKDEEVVEKNTVEEENVDVEEKKEKTASEEHKSVSTPSNPAAKSRLTAGILGIFLGCFGVHNFYLGYNGKAIGQLLLTLIGWILCFTGPLAAWIWGLIEGILILTGSIDKDANGIPLAE